MNRITIIHPSKGRPELAYNAAKNFLTNAKQYGIRYFLSLDSDDATSEQYHSYFDKLKTEIGNKHLVNTNIDINYSCIEAINRVAKKIHFDILVVISDDFQCSEGWDVQIMDAVKDKTNFVLKTNDGNEGWIVTFPVMDYAYYKGQGYVYNPAYKHMFCDTEMTHVADITGRLIVRNDIVIPHKTAITNCDSLNQRNNKTWEQGKAVYLSRVKCNFNLQQSEIVKEVEHQPHLDWIKQNL